MENAENKECFICNCPLMDSERSLVCNTCNLRAHSGCTHLSLDTLTLLESLAGKEGGSYWTCKTCNTFTRKFIGEIKLVNDRVDRVEHKTDAVCNDVKQLNTEMFALRNDVKNINDRLSSTTVGTTGVCTSELADELTERGIRKKNVVMFGVQEIMQSVASVEEERELIKQAVQRVLTAMGAGDVCGAVVNAVRLGRVQQDRPRPIHVRLSNESQQSRVLSCARNLRFTQFSMVSVHEDETWRQRQRRAELRKECEQLNATLTPAEVAANLEWRVLTKEGSVYRAKVTKRQPSRPFLATGLSGGPPRGEVRGGAPSEEIQEEERESLRRLIQQDAGRDRAGPMDRSGAAEPAQEVINLRTQEGIRSEPADVMVGDGIMPPPVMTAAAAAATAAAGNLASRKRAADADPSDGKKGKHHRTRSGLQPRRASVASVTTFREQDVAAICNAKGLPVFQRPVRIDTGQ